jgi:hypothetical protein
MATSATKCWCNVCGVQMETYNYVPGRNRCSKLCREIGKTSTPKDVMQYHEHYVRKGRAPKALRMAMGEI